MIFMELILFVALTSGSLLSSFVYAATSAAFVQSISCLIIILATLFIIFYLPKSFLEKSQTWLLTKNDSFFAKNMQKTLLVWHFIHP